MEFVGGTNTDAVILDQNNNIVAKLKPPQVRILFLDIYESLDKVLFNLILM